MGGMLGVTAAEDSTGDDPEDGSEDSAARSPDSGEVLVGALSIKSVMSSGVFAGVTLSMNWKAGRRRTVVLWSE